MLNVFYAGTDKGWAEYQPELLRAFRDVNLSVNLTNVADDPTAIDYIVYAPNGSFSNFTPFTNVKLVQNLWAGVEVPTANKTLTQPLARMVEPGLTLGMTDYVMGHVLRHHLGTDHFSKAAPGDWDEDMVPPLAQSQMVGVLGLGALGMYCAKKMDAFGFQACGWSRTQKHDDNVTCYSGSDGLKQVLAKSDYLVLLLPNTPDTKGIINAQNIALMKDGVAIINPGRGPLIDEQALLAGLNTGKISGATLDVFDVEPLPKDHDYWAHPNVLVTPHIASSTRKNTACDVVVQNIVRGEAGQPFLHLVNKSAGY